MTQVKAAYASLHDSDNSVERYLRKLQQPFEHIRHQIEERILAKHMKGKCYDCTIGLGRFIGKLPNVTEYVGMDFSIPFVNYIRQEFSNVSVKQGNLIEAIQEPDESVDSILCLRSLSGIGHLDKIIPEMTRVLNKGGIMAIDYGRMASHSKSAYGDIHVDNENIEAVLANLPLHRVETYYVDGFFSPFKKHALFYALTAKVRAFVPDVVLLSADKVLSTFYWQRQIIILQKK